MNCTKIADVCGTGMKRTVQNAASSKGMWIAAGVAAGLALMGTGAYLMWNSRQARMLRTAKRTGKLLRRTGAILQAVADAAE
jgi:hypothetical protein